MCHDRSHVEIEIVEKFGRKMERVKPKIGSKKLEEMSKYSYKKQICVVIKM